jgi:signal transduction histidine kinase
MVVAGWQALLRTLAGGHRHESVARDEPAMADAGPSAADLTQLRHQADAAAQVKADFLATINHELRTPLNAVIGLSELLEQEVFGPLGHPRYVEYAQMIRSSGDHLLRAITEILDVSRSGAGLVNLSLRPVQLDQVVAGCRRLLAAQAEKAGVEIVIEPSTAPPILADAARLEHALLNLISNAVKFSLRGGRVTIATAVHARGAEVVISDNGVGMNSADLLLALEPFRQVDSSLARRYNGMGLGLPVAKRLIEMHGGMLLIDSLPGYGTSVTVILPHRPTCPPDDPAL